MWSPRWIEAQSGVGVGTGPEGSGLRCLPQPLLLKSMKLISMVGDLAFCDVRSFPDEQARFR